jgi:uncharacterized membrane protein YgdD (TMEM256/DUF423 family)
MIRIWLAVAGIGGFCSVVAGALAAHVAADPKAVELLHTGALYGLVHAVALVGLAALMQNRETGRNTIAVAGWCFGAGIVLFSFSLFVLALTSVRWIGTATPLGGVAFMLGWLALATLALQRR